jgi:CheY-like chemotaxis protein
MKPAQPILLVDDDRAWLDTLSEYLRGKGFTVLAAHNAIEGLAALAKHKISLVVCDYRMPGMDGLAFVRHLQQHQDRVAVLMVSSDEEPALAARAVAAGARGFASKTIVPKQLLRKLQQIMDALTPTLPAPSSLHLWQRLLPSPYKNRARRRRKS